MILFWLIFNFHVFADYLFLEGGVQFTQCLEKCQGRSILFRGGWPIEYGTYFTLIGLDYVTGGFTLTPIDSKSYRLCTEFHEIISSPPVILKQVCLPNFELKSGDCKQFSQEETFSLGSSTFETKYHLSVSR